MKSLKKLGAIFLAFVLAFSLCATAFAADDVIGNSDDTGQITVSGIKDKAAGSDLTVSAYPILLATYDETGSFAGYYFLYEGYVSFGMDDITDEDGNIVFTEAQLAEIQEVALVTGNYQTVYTTAVAVLAADNKTFGDTAANVYTMTSSDATSATVDGETQYSYSTEVAIGSYLVHVNNSEAVEYNVAVVSTYYAADDTGENKINPGSVDMIKDGVTWMKADQPSVEKKITGTTSSENEDANTGMEDDQDIANGGKGASVNLGDTVEYTVTVSPIPYYAGDYPIFNVTDTLSNGLTYTEDSLTVQVYVGIGEEGADGNGYITLAQGTDYTLATPTETSNTITVDFVVNGSYTLNDYEGSNIKITYSAVLNDNAVYNENPNDNDVVLDYSVDSTVDGRDNTDEDKTYTYTFDIDGSGFPDSDHDEWSDTWRVITKTGEEKHEESNSYDNEYALSGAEFELYTDADCNSQYSNSSFKGTVITDEHGQFAIYGLSAGTYYLKETKAPTGYALNETVYKINIETSYNEDGTLASWEITTTAIKSDGTEVPVGDSSFTVDYGTVTGTTQQDKDKNFLDGYYGLEFTASGENTYTATDASGNTVTAVKTINSNDGSYAGWTVTTTNSEGNVLSEDILYVTIETDDSGNSTYTVTKADVNEAEIGNSKTPELPNTGGIGTTLFYIIGALIIVAAIVLFVTMRRRNNRQAAE